MLLVRMQFHVETRSIVKTSRTFMQLELRFKQLKIIPQVQ